MMKTLTTIKKVCYLVSAACFVALAISAGCRGEWITMCAWICAVLAVMNAVILEYRLAESEVLLNMYRREYEKRAELYRAVMAGAEHCVVCGDVIPEGRQVCPKCERGMDHGGNDI